MGAVRPISPVIGDVRGRYGVWTCFIEFGFTDQFEERNAEYGGEGKKGRWSAMRVSYYGIVLISLMPSSGPASTIGWSSGRAYGPTHSQPNCWIDQIQVRLLGLNCRKSIRFYLLKWLAGCRKDRRLAGIFCETPADDIAIGGLKFNQPGDTLGLFGRDHGCAGPGKGIKNDFAAAADILDRVGDQRGRFHGGMVLQVFLAVLAEGVAARIGPQIAPEPTLLAETESVGMGRLAMLEDEYHLMLGSIEAAHAGIGLCPYRAA